MGNELLDFRRRAIALDLCDEYKRRWNACKNSADFAKLASNIEGMRFMADSSAYGWGLSTEFLSSFLKDHINGKAVIEQDGYTGEIYVGFKGKTKINATLTLFIDCDCEVEVDQAISQVFVAGGDVVFHNKPENELIINEYRSDPHKANVRVAYVHKTYFEVMEKSGWINK